MAKKHTLHLIAREEEQKTLQSLLASNAAEFLAIYGRRRVGKTFLIREFFKAKPVIFFNTTGTKDGSFTEQIKHFTQAVGITFYNGAELKENKNWSDALEILTRAISSLDKNKKVILFFDEFPWMATPKSELLNNLDYYWNQYWSRDNRIKLIICGSSASWIIDKIINNKGGLHNRITKQLLLEPFNLLDTRKFLHCHGIKLNNQQVLQIYMLTGGVPYYLLHVKKGLSATQNIECLAFHKDGLLLKEFDNLFSSLFDNHEINLKLIRAIANHRYGIGQEELFKKIDKNLKGKVGLGKLKELEDAGFIMSFKPYQHKQKGIYYKVIDEYTLFYLRWIDPIKNTLFKGKVSEGYWEKQQISSAWYSWAGLAFESICYKHIKQITKALSLNAVAVPYVWRYLVSRGSDEVGAQIDLLFDRDDSSMTLCEIKYTKEAFVINKDYAEVLSNKAKVFINKTKTNKQIFWVMISATGVKNNMYKKAILDNVVVLDDLF